MADKELTEQRRAELVEQLRQLGVVKVGGDPSEELLEKLLAVGLKVRTGQVGGMKVVSLGHTEPEDSGPRLEDYLERMNADQLKLVSKRYHPNANATRMEVVKKAVGEALSKPALLEAMIAQLSAVELELLQLVKHGGGETSGWDLIIHAALRRLPLPRHGVSGSWYKMHFAKSEGMTYLAALLRDGLLLPRSFAAPWFDSYGLGRSQASEDAVGIDPRVLDQIPELERVPGSPRLDIEPVSAQPLSPHPVRALLELHETLKLVLEEGQVQVTREGRIGRQTIARMSKKRPWLQSLERNLEVMLSNGLLRQGEAKDLWKPRAELFYKASTAPLPMQYWMLLTGFLDSYEQPEESWQSNPEGVYSVEVGRKALLEGLSLLPEYPVDLDGFLNALWKRVLQYVGERRSGYYYGRDEDRKTLPKWYRKTLLESFHPLGLVSLAPLDKNSHAIGRGLGLEWFKQGKQMAAQSQQGTSYPSQPLSPEQGAEAYRRLGLDPTTHQPLERSLLVQPNFEVLVYLDRLTTFALAALSCADCTRVDAQTASYTISRSSVYRSLESGLSIDRLLELLQSHSSTPVPAAVVTSLREWAERRERLSVQENTRLLEYPSAAERDAALAQAGGKAIGERFMQAHANTRLPKEVLRHNYQSVPSRSLRFEADGRFRIKGASDLAARAIIASLAQPNPDKTYSFKREVLAQGRFSSNARETFLARVEGGLPPQLEALIGIWEGKSASPIIAGVSLFQHPSAAALARHPELAQHLGSPISDTAYLVRTGQEAALEQALKALGITPSHQLQTNLKAQAIQGSVMQTGLATRKIRELAEAAILGRRKLELQYHKEKVAYNRYGYPSSSKGKVVTEKIDPNQISYDGSTPYLEGQALEDGEPRRIRLGYVLGIAVL